MNLERISYLTNLISNLRAALSRLRQRKSELEEMSGKTTSVQGRIDTAVANARKRVDALSGYGLKAQFISELMEPINRAPNCSGIHSAVVVGIMKTDEEISGTQSQINKAANEKTLLEMEP